jgi:hypothetical protein
MRTICSHGVSVPSGATSTTMVLRSASFYAARIAASRLLYGVDVIHHVVAAVGEMSVTPFRHEVSFPHCQRGCRRSIQALTWAF